MTIVNKQFNFSTYRKHTQTDTVIPNDSIIPTPQRFHILI